MTDDLATLRALVEWTGQTVGATARDLADAAGRDVDDVQLDLDRYRHDGLVDVAISPLHSAFYTPSFEGEKLLAHHDGVTLTPEADPGFDFPDEAA